MMRLFLGLSIPSHIVTQLLQRLGLVKKELTARTWVRPEHFHITLIFLGEIQPLTLEALHPKFLSVTKQTNPFSLYLQGWGAFPNMKKPSLLWAGVKGECDPLIQLVNAFQEVIQPEVSLHNNKRYVPHITLARKLQTDRSISFLNEVYPLQTEQWVVEQMHVYRSYLHSSGGHYEILKTYRFQ